MFDFLANLSFLFTEYIVPETIREASKARFKAVECHWLYSVSFGEVQMDLEEYQNPMVGLNSVSEKIEHGDYGLAALPDRVEKYKSPLIRQSVMGQRLALEMFK